MSKLRLDDRILSYKQVLSDGTFQETHQELVSVLQQIRAYFLKQNQTEYSIASIMHGYIDYTYFYMQSPILKKRRLKLGVVLNHQSVGFELWLLGNTKAVQKMYWSKLRDTKWIVSDTMPEYSIFKSELVSRPHFEDVPALLNLVWTQFNSSSKEILASLSQIDSE